MKVEVKIVEKLVKCVIVEAESVEAAEEIVEDQYSNCETILTDEDFAEVDFIGKQVSDSVTMTLCGVTETWSRKENAQAFLENGIEKSNGELKARYQAIHKQFLEGKTICTDEGWSC